MDLALNIVQGLIHLKTQTNNLYQNLPWKKLKSNI